MEDDEWAESDSTTPADDLNDSHAPFMLSENSAKCAKWIDSLWSKWIAHARHKDPTLFCYNLNMLSKSFRLVINDYLPKFFAEFGKRRCKRFPRKNSVLHAMQMKVKNWDKNTTCLKTATFFGHTNIWTKKEKFVNARMWEGKKSRNCDFGDGRTVVETRYLGQKQFKNATLDRQPLNRLKFGCGMEHREMLECLWMTKLFTQIGIQKATTME